MEQTLDINLKRKAAPGIDGLTAEMIYSKVLVDFWHCLFNWCWNNGMIPSERRRSAVVPIPKKRGSGVCKTDEYHGISLVSLAYKAMCGIIHGRLTQLGKRIWWLKSKEGLGKEGDVEISC